MTQFREVIYQKDFQKNRAYMLAGDIGGTNSNFGIFELRDNKPLLLISLHAKSQTVADYTALVADLLAYSKDHYQITFERACFGAAGIIEHNQKFVKPTNLDVVIDAQAIMQGTGLKNLVLINDFVALALGIDSIAPQDIITIHEGTLKNLHGYRNIHAQKACIGAGTGMGKVALLWDKHAKRYIPLASEGGHADCAAQTPQESALFAFIQADAQRHATTSVSWEDVLSGSGIARIYKFLGTQKEYPATEIAQEIAAGGFKPDLISAYAAQDQRCKETFNLYTVFYARCAKNFVLDTLALNGIYIAGGIAAKNIDLFKQPAFYAEFIKSYKQSVALQEVPIYVIADYNVSLYGAAAYTMYQEQGIV